MIKNFVKYKLLKKLIIKSKKPEIIFSRSSTILPSFINKSFKVHNGKNFIKIIVKKPMVGFKFGSFVQTKTNFQYKKWLIKNK